MYVLDEMLFPFEVLVENYSEEDKIFQVISKINPSQIDQYYFYTGCGRRLSNRKAIFRALILKKLPSESTFSRFGTELAEIPGLRELLGKIAEDLAAGILAITGSKGQIIVDGSDIPAHEKAVKSSDTGANFGHRTASANAINFFNLSYGYLFIPFIAFHFAIGSIYIP